MSENAETVHSAPLSLKFGSHLDFLKKEGKMEEKFSEVCRTAIMLTDVAMVTLARRDGMMKSTWAVFL